MIPKNQTPVTSYLRRQEARRQRGEVSGSLWQKISRRVNPRVLLIWAGFYVGAVAILFAGRDSMPYRLMQTVKQDIAARVDFQFTDTIETENLRQKAKATVPFIFSCNEKPLSTIQGRLTELLDAARAAGSDRVKFDAEAEKRKWHVTSDEAVKGLMAYAADEKGLATWGEMVKHLIERLTSQPVVDQLGPAAPRQAGHKSRLRRSGQPAVETVMATDALQLASRDNIEKAARQSAAADFPEALRSVVVKTIVEAMVSDSDDKKAVFTPVWRYDTAATGEAQRAVEDAVPAVVRGYKKDETLVSSGANKHLTTSELDLLKREHQAFLKAQREDPTLWQKHQCFQLGIAGIALLITIGLGSYVSLYESRTFQTPGQMLGLAALMLVMIGAARLIELAEWPYDLPVEFSTGIVTLAAAFMAIAFSQRFALGGTIALAILASLASRGEGNLGLFLTLLTGAGIAIFMLKEIRSRSKLIVVGTLAGLGAAGTSICVGFVAGEDIGYVLLHAACACLGTLVAGFVVQGILPQFERIFGIATSMTLLEWCDASRPLLRLLAQNAPGTYSHSMMLSQMAEEAAEAIEARGLLARVGAMYHDVGKANKPDYFVENQEARISRHDKLSPTMSMLIILGHVKDGIEMARAYRLPKILHHFISEHHGTTVVRYFHRAAQESEARTKRFCDRDVPESEFRYPGPKPSSKESAILMLCDGCEGAVRALPEPTPGRIESVVHQVVMDRLNDGQFDHADITLRELNIVERSLVKSLAGIHHSRIQYPEKLAGGRVLSNDAEKSTAAANGQHANGGNANGNGNGNGGERGRTEPAGQSSERTSEVARPS